MAALYRLKGLGWGATCAVVAISCYLISSQVAAERKKLDRLDAKVASARRDIRALETEFDVRANLAQLERWNGDTLALVVPTSAQFVRNEEALASLSPAVEVRPLGDGEPKVQTAALIVPSSPVYAAPTVPVAVPGTTTAPAARPAAPAAGLVKVAAVRVTAGAAAAAPRLTPAVALSTRGEAPRVRTVAMLSDGTLGELLSAARAEKTRLR
jgi:hypothetical protein